MKILLYAFLIFASAHCRGNEEVAPKPAKEVSQAHAAENQTSMPEIVESSITAAHLKIIYRLMYKDLLTGPTRDLSSPIPPQSSFIENGITYSIQESTPGTVNLYSFTCRTRLFHSLKDTLKNSFRQPLWERLLPQENDQHTYTVSDNFLTCTKKINAYKDSLPSTATISCKGSLPHAVYKQFLHKLAQEKLPKGSPQRKHEMSQQAKELAAKADEDALETLIYTAIS